MIDYMNETRKILLRLGNNAMSDKEILANEIMEFEGGRIRKLMLTGKRYYEGDHDIKHKKRSMRMGKGEEMEVLWLPNSKLKDNQYRKMVKQKSNFLCGKPVRFETENNALSEQFSYIFAERFQNTLLSVAKDALNCGIGWMHVYVDEKGEFRFKRFPAYSVIPFWRDDEHTELELACRVYEIQAYEGRTKKTVKFVDVFSDSGIDHYIMENGALKDSPMAGHENYLELKSDHGEMELNWERIPLIAFKRNEEEQPLIDNVKSIQDAINTILSNFEDNMLQDAVNTIYVLINYGGQNLAEFRANLMAVGAVKIDSTSDAPGDIKTLNVEVNCENYKAILEVLKKAMIENAMGYDAKDDRLGANANQMNIQSMYNDIDLDADEMETQFQFAMKQVLWFVRRYLYNTQRIDCLNDEIKVVFKRDMMMNETEKMQTLTQAGVEISQETLLTQVPYVKDAKAEMERVRQERETERGQEDAYAGAFGGDTGGAGDVDAER